MSNVGNEDSIFFEEKKLPPPWTDWSEIEEISSIEGKKPAADLKKPLPEWLNEADWIPDGEK